MMSVAQCDFQELQSFTKGPALVDLRLVIAKIKKLSSPWAEAVASSCLCRLAGLAGVQGWILTYGLVPGDLTMTATNAAVGSANLVWSREVKISGFVKCVRGGYGENPMTALTRPKMPACMQYMPYMCAYIYIHTHEDRVDSS